MRKYPIVVGRMLNTNHTIEVDKITVIAKFFKYHNRVVRESVELRKNVLQLTETAGWKR